MGEFPENRLNSDSLFNCHPEFIEQKYKIY